MSSLLIVEDDPDMRRLVGFTLSVDPSIEICGEAASASEAIELATKHRPNIILLDHFIEGNMTGLAAAPQLRDAVPGVKILLFTSHDLRTETDREPAVDGYLQKDRIKDLLPTVQRMLAGT